MEYISFRREANEYCNDGNDQAEPDNDFQERTPVILGYSKSSHGDKHNGTRDA